ncbi:MAG: protein-export chaperone SecB [Bacteroidales bacterium]|nr:protein-export chaperone SecB [Bacteroidales bacterium]
MDKVEKSAFQFKGFQIVETHIVKKEGQEVSGNIHLDFNPRGKILKDQNLYKILLGITIHDDDESIKANVEAIGYFEFSDSIDQDTLDNLFYVNAPAILFPYIRAYISTLTNLSGIETVTLPTINLSSIGGVLQKNTTEF